ncbi:MAG: septum formation initiator family protein [Thermodesulfovibrio sp.]|nr:septum formation initiator family protein [Thermodesulfovibrio sp.]
MRRFALKEQLKREQGRRMKIYILLLGLILITLIYSFLFGNMGYFKYRELKKNEQKLLTEINQIAKGNNTLKQEIDLLKRDQDYMEKYAREKFGLVKPGEMVFQFKYEEK